jgi:hypothetical protein
MCGKKAQTKKFGGEAQRKETLGRTRCKWEDNSKWMLKENWRV